MPGTVGGSGPLIEPRLSNGPCEGGCCPIPRLPAHRAHWPRSGTCGPSTTDKQDAVALAEVLHRWKEKYPAVKVVAESRSGNPAIRLVGASREASLVVVGRRIRRSPLGAHIGPVTHAVLHHATAPVAVIAHD